MTSSKATPLGSNSISDDRSTVPAILPEIDPATCDPLKTAQGIYVTVHGHFYQPPRENPYLDAIERQPSAAPFHDWNERVHYECYRPNAFARILNERGEIIDIVNNFEYLSFNIGPTLMSWLESHDLEVYQRILEADRKSCDRLDGHGNAIAQVYNHIIMPLASERDKRTQIRWGKADFRSRFGRDPEGMWLAETAVDYPTLEALVAEGIQFIVLAPSQVQRARQMPTAEHPDPEWHEVGGAQIDPTRPYRCYLKPSNARNGDRPYIDIFFYDGPISRDMGFNDILSNAHHFSGRLGLAVHGDRRPSQLIAVATDGETFGHHKGGTEKCVAYAVTHEFPRCGWTVTNFAHYLSISPPTWECELKPVTAWSCSHGVARWQDDCGCGGGGDWNQQWRRPLRDALDGLRDRLSEIYEQAGRQYFRDPWQARDEYIQVIRDRRSETIDRFLEKCAPRPLDSSDRVDALRLLEMQRHALLMYTSCGWFFDELSRPEGTQILRYAARAIELAGDVTGVQLEDEFVGHLALAPSNVDFFNNGAAIYEHLVRPAQISLEQIAAHYAISSLFTSYAADHQLYCYRTSQLDYQLQRMGMLSVAMGQLQLVSEITTESVRFVFAVVHLGGWDFHCCVRPFTGRRAYAQMKQQLFDALNEASAAHIILTMNRHLDGQSFSLRDLFAEERHRIMRLLTQETLLRLDQLYTQVYRDNYGVLVAFHRDGFPVPQELQVAAEIALGHRALTAVRELERETSALGSGDPQSITAALGELAAIAIEAERMHAHLNISEAKQILEQLILRSLWHLLHEGQSETQAQDLERLQQLLEIGRQLELNLALDRAQELFFTYLMSQLVPQLEASPTETVPRSGTHSLGDRDWAILQLGQTLAVDVSCWLARVKTPTG